MSQRKEDRIPDERGAASLGAEAAGGTAATAGIGGVRVDDAASAGDAAQAVAGIGAASKAGKRAPSRRRLFLRAAVFDFLLVLAASTALVMTVGYGFMSAPDLRSNPLVCAGLAIPLLVILFAGSWSKKALLPSALGAIAYAVLVIAVFTGLSTAAHPVFKSGQINDVEGSNFIFSLIAMAVPALVYLLSRRRAGAVVLLIGTVLSCEFIQFLYREWMVEQHGLVLFIVAVTAALALLVFQGYRSSLYSAKRSNDTAFGAAAGYSLLIAGICMAVGVAVFYGIVAAANLSTLEIKPFEDYYTRPIIYYSGNYEKQPIDDPDRTTSRLSKEESDTRQNAEGGSEKKSTDSEDQTQSETEQTGMMAMLDPSSWSETFQTIGFRQFVLTALMVLAVIAAILLAAILLRRYWRTRRLNKIADKSCAYRVWYLYGFLLERFRRMKLPKDDALTPMEYAMATREAMIPYEKGTDGVNFLDVTLAYQRACYDPQHCTEDDYGVVERFYKAFFKNACKQTGALKWAFWRFWRI